MSKETKQAQRACSIKGFRALVHKRMLMCAGHWAMCPKPLRGEVWRYYRPGQEKTGMPSPLYVEAARNAIQRVEQEERIAAVAGIQINLL